MTPLERAVRALKNWHELADLIDDPEDTSELALEASYRGQARTVLWAIREPSDLAVTEGITASLNAGQGVEPETTTVIYQAMIDSALGER